MNAAFLVQGQYVNDGMTYVSGDDPASVAIPLLANYALNETPRHEYTPIMLDRLTQTGGFNDQGIWVPNPHPNYKRGDVIGDDPDSKKARGEGEGQQPVFGRGGGFSGHNDKAISDAAKNAIPDFTKTAITYAAFLLIGIILLGVGAYSIVSSQSFGNAIGNIGRAGRLAAA